MPGIQLLFFPYRAKIMTLLLMAAALGTDAMSLAVGIGLQGTRRREGLKIVAVVGLFHIAMPLIGALGGQYFSRLVGGIARVASVALVAIIGLRMIWCCLKAPQGPNREKWEFSGLSLMLLALCTSVDAFSAGLGLGALGYNAYSASLVFGLFGAAMTAAGLYLGYKMCTPAGKYGELAGGTVLVLLSIKILLEG